MDINEFLSPADALVEHRALDKANVLKELSRRAARTLGLRPAQVVDSVQKREKLGPTGMGGGVAIPHARFAELKKPFGVVARLTQPVDFDAIDGRPVDIVFLLLAPAAPEANQLNALACIARKLRDPAVTSRIRSATNGIEMFDALTHVTSPDVGRDSVGEPGGQGP